MLRVLIWLFFLLSVAANAKQHKLPFDDNALNVVFDSKVPVTFVGKKSLTPSGQVAAPILYPGDTAGVFLVSVLTHAAISGGVKKSQQNKEQEEANKVLEPYQTYISDVNEEFLTQNTLSQDISTSSGQLQLLFGDQHKENSRWQVSVAPVFAMTQNQSSFLIYNQLTFVDRSLTVREQRKIKKTKKGYLAPNQKLVVIVSDPVLEEDRQAFWLRNDATAFNDAIKNLYNESFHLGVIRHFGGLGNAEAKQVTIKYLENGVKKIERGYIISQTCQRTVFESLAGEVKSVPNIDFAVCGSV